MDGYQNRIKFRIAQLRANKHTHTHTHTHRDTHARARAHDLPILFTTDLQTVNYYATLEFTARADLFLKYKNDIYKKYKKQYMS